VIEKEERDEYRRKEKKEHLQRAALLKEFARIKTYQEKHQTQQQQQQQ
tara:strand:+ start:251317 stop:251460 length:144 start_codon:yes stop_codon:yes gene_type:complete